MRDTSAPRTAKAPLYFLGALVAFIAVEAIGLLVAPKVMRELQPYALGVLAFLLASMIATHSLVEAGERKRVLARRAEQEKLDESEQECDAVPAGDDAHK